MTYNRRDHIMKIIDLMFCELVSSGGDGDVLWYSRYYKIDELIPLVKEYNNKLEYPFEVIKFNNNIHWGSNQEWIIITNNEDVYKTHPDWFDFVLRN